MKIRHFKIPAFVGLTVILFFSIASHAAENYGISIFGDLKYPANFTHFDYANPTAPKGGETTQAVIGTFDSLNPDVLKGVAAAGLGLTSDTLLADSTDEPFSKYGLIAKSINVANDRKSVVFALRPEAKWHDGTPITADDVVFSFNTLKEKGHPFYKAYYRDIVSAEKIADDKVKFTFAGGKNRELPLIIGQMPVISKVYYSTHDFEKSTSKPPLSSGPYEIEKVEPGKRIIYKRVENYWGKNLPVNKGRYNFDRIIYDYYRDETVAIEALKAHAYDFRQENISKNWAIAYNIPAVKEGLLKKEEIPHEIPTGMQAFVMNLRRTKFSDPQVREALNYAFDFEWENKNLFYSAYTRTGSYFSNSEFAARNLPSKKELELLNQIKDKIPKEVFTEEYKNPTTDGSGNNRTNLVKAKELLEKAGWVIKGGQLVNDKTGEAMEIEFLIDSPAFERVIAPYIKNLEKLGITAKIRNVDSAQYQKRVEDFDFDIVISTYGESNSPGNEQIDYWHSSKADVKGSKNMAGIKNPAVDFLVEKIIHAETKPDMIAATRALDRVLLWNYYTVPNWYNRSFRVLYWDKFGKPKTRPKFDLGFDTWWIDSAKEKALEKALKK